MSNERKLEDSIEAVGVDFGLFQKLLLLFGDSINRLILVKDFGGQPETSLDWQLVLDLAQAQSSCQVSTKHHAGLKLATFLQKFKIFWCQFFQYSVTVVCLCYYLLFYQGCQMVREKKPTFFKRAGIRRIDFSDNSTPEGIPGESCKYGDFGVWGYFLKKINSNWVRLG